jgi:nucleoside-diphosphate-sugar epimerase
MVIGALEVVVAKTDGGRRRRTRLIEAPILPFCRRERPAALRGLFCTMTKPMIRAKLTVLATGGTGFLGANLVRRLAADGHDVVLAKRSSSSMARLAGLAPSLKTFDLDKNALEDLFARHRFDVVLHCATDYGRKETPASQVIDANLLLPLKLLELAAEAGTRVFVNTDTILDKRVSVYALSKHQFSDWLKTFSRQLTTINVALEHFFGPGDDATKFVSRMVVDSVAAVPRIALTPGQQKRDFIYIDDVVDAFAVLIERSAGMPNGYHSFEVGTGRKTSIRDFMALLVRLAGNSATRLDFGAIPYRENEVMETNVDIRALEAFGWSPRVPLEEGLRRTIAAERARAAVR